MNLDIYNIDASSFPNVSLYVDASDLDEKTLSNLKESDFEIIETLADGSSQTLLLSDIREVVQLDDEILNFVFDLSGDLTVQQQNTFKNLLSSFLNQVDYSHNTIQFTSLDNNLFTIETLSSDIENSLKSFQDMPIQTETQFLQILELAFANNVFKEPQSIVLFTNAISEIMIEKTTENDSILSDEKPTLNTEDDNEENIVDETEKETESDATSSGDDSEKEEAILPNPPTAPMIPTEPILTTEEIISQKIIDLANEKGITIHIIGIQEKIENSLFYPITKETGGSYFLLQDKNLSSYFDDAMADKDRFYVLEYLSQNTSQTSDYRELLLQTSESNTLYAQEKIEFLPYTSTMRTIDIEQPTISNTITELPSLPDTVVSTPPEEVVASDDIQNINPIVAPSSNFSSSVDMIIPNSNTKVLTEADLSGLSLAQLRIARNEIYARHGRQFQDEFLTEWFNSKSWYTSIAKKYSSSAFDALSPQPTSSIEYDNIQFILEYENKRIANGDIFDHLSTALLTEYDLALSKTTLQKALIQIEKEPSTTITQQNKTLIQNAINQL